MGIRVRTGGMREAIKSARPLGPGVLDTAPAYPFLTGRVYPSFFLPRLASRIAPRMLGVQLHLLLSALTGMYFKNNLASFFESDLLFLLILFVLSVKLRECKYQCG